MVFFLLRRRGIDEEASSREMKFNPFFKRAFGKRKNEGS